MQQLPLEALRGGKEANLFSSHGVGNGLLGREVLLLEIDVGHALDTPANAEVGFLMLPVFSEDSAPQGAR